ncbi:hypothetical protein [Pseudomonas vanderleydeniana]|uniref:Uncharacterized protein n=1 Tax=Pseudomonas vanderleydeniana TaxID=2745495 RepID=A0A9E6TUS8_9PSED|nr:hypothetical protein [Pseudomonas vanderleydeniana]QXI30615.1 hypothetical protein HU752_012010 [Pseudomonas vanderleydeniana]
MHWIQVLIGPLETLTKARSLLPAAAICPLPQGLALIPVTHTVEVQLQSQATAHTTAAVPHSGELAVGITELASRLSDQGPILYAATYIHGGTGGQDAVIWHKGEVILNLGDDEDHMSAWPDSPISRALRHIGVTVQTGQDEFDALGLGRYRSNEAWAEKASQA